jgi:hypothetical protein
MSFVLLQLTESMRSVREQFQDGGSPLFALMVVLGLVLVVAFAYWLTNRQQASWTETAPNDPQQLFDDMLDKLDLNGDQRAFLRRLALDLELEHPTTVLLSERLFRSSLAEWQRLLRQGDYELPFSRELIEATYVDLFPSVDTVPDADPDLVGGSARSQG